MRGSVYSPQTRKLVKKAQELFEQDLSFCCLSLADLYGGKICAALDRQHPRDLFDVYILLKNEGITEEIRKAFIVYLISHPRPIIELLSPTLKDFSDVFNNEFRGLTNTQTKYDDLVKARLELIHFVKRNIR
ncbi:MAG: nucleotidyl transferase AbiEii/AbiGii toxin family protein [bacterium]